MKRLFFKLIVNVVFFMVALWTGSSQASIITDSGSFWVRSGDTYSVDLDGFDTSLGVLNSVYIHFLSGYETRMSVYGRTFCDSSSPFSCSGPGFGGAYDIRAGGSSSTYLSLTYMLGGNNYERNRSAYLNGYCWEEYSCRDDDDDESTFDETLFSSNWLSDEDFSQFIELGNFYNDFTVDVEVDTNTRISTCRGQNSDELCTISASASLFGTAYVEYNYTEHSVSVSEPQSLAVFALGLAGFMVRLVRKA